MVTEKFKVGGHIRQRFTSVETLCHMSSPEFVISNLITKRPPIWCRKAMRRWKRWQKIVRQLREEQAIAVKAGKTITISIPIETASEGEDQ